MSFKIYKIKKEQLTQKDTKNIYLFLINNIKGSIFSTFGHEFFLELLKINYHNTYYIKKNNQIVSYVSYINKTNEHKLKKKLIFFILKNIFLNLPLLVLNYKIFFKNHKPPKNYIQLIHLVIKINKSEKKIKSFLHKKIEQLNRKVSHKKYRGVYAIYQNDNTIAAKYYFKNKYKIFKKNFFFSFVKKKI